MLMKAILVFLCVSLLSAEPRRHPTLVRVPRPQSSFNLNKYLGVWYMQAFLVPDSVPGFKKYSDDVTQYVLEPDGRLVMRLTYRTQRCVTVVNDYIPLKRPGMFALKDGFGDSLSGGSIVVATDYRSFAIKWGCAGALVKRICKDPYVIAKTRKRKPCKKTVGIIERLLVRLFGLRMKEMTRYSNEQTCPDNNGSSCPAFQKLLGSRGNGF